MRKATRTARVGEKGLKAAVAVAALVLIAAGVYQDLPPLWLGAIVAGTVTVVAGLWGEILASVLFMLQLTIAWTLPLLLGRPLDPLDLLGMVVLIVPAIFGAAHATIFAPRSGRMHLIASHRWEVPSGFSIPMESVVGEAAEKRAPVYLPDVRRHPRYVRAPNAPETLSELAIPLLMEERVAAVLNIEHAVTDAFGDEEYRTLIAFGKMVEEALERASLQMQLVEMLEVIRNLAQSDDPAKLFEDTVTSAIRLIPGAEAGSLMVVEQGYFRFAAAAGYDMQALGAIAGVRRENQLRWYAGSEEDFVNGVPRLLTGDGVSQASLASLVSDEHRNLMLGAGRLGEITANICVPISYGDNVLGMLNIDSFAPSNPFGPHALLLAETFAQQLAVIIRQALYRDALERAVVTDPLTKLGNREGFNRQLNVELARARRYGRPFSLVMFDLNGFKQINDRLGHQAGDVALARVARAMEDQRREGDSIFRWAGDEFGLMLPETGRVEAWTVAGRYAAAVSGVEVDGVRLTASFGIASYPEDGTDAEKLLRKADDLMYRDKPA